ncbi:fimbrillin family protein [Phocaeicola sp.]|uniref:fimbrillin family protein n=1 Tax=Phocaeicola sp. TaxID=2773926 RepID=UPI003AB67CE3
MRKTLIGMATVLVAMSSCMEDEVLERNQGNALAFRPSIDKALSRSGDGNVTDLGKLQEFKVTATIDGQSNYFTNMLVSKASSGSTWNTEHTYYWPKYDLGFYAYAPTNIGGVSINDAGKKITGFTPGKNVDNQVDLLVAYNTGNRRNNETQGVELNFKHALSQIDVQAKCSNPNIEIVVKSISFVNVKKKGDFTYPADITSTNNTLANCWNPSSEVSDAAYYKASFGQGQEVTLGTDPKSINPSKNNFMLIPQKLTKWDKTSAANGAYIAVLCRISSKDGEHKTQLYPELNGTNAEKFGSIIVPIDTNWEAGKKYTYTLNFCGEGGGAGQVDPNPDENDPNVDPNPKPGSNGGDPVLGNPIKFTVKVESWTEIPAEEIKL